MTNATWNSLATGASTQIGANITYSGTNTVSTAFTLNGTACNGGSGASRSARSRTWRGSRKCRGSPAVSAAWGPAAVTHGWAWSGDDGQPEHREQLGVGEAGDGGDLVVRQGDDHDPVATAAFRAVVGQVGGQGRMAVGPRGDKAD